MKPWEFAFDIASWIFWIWVLQSVSLMMIKLGYKEFLQFKEDIKRIKLEITVTKSTGEKKVFSTEE